MTCRNANTFSKIENFVKYVVVVVWYKCTLVIAQRTFDLEVVDCRWIPF